MIVQAYFPNLYSQHYAPILKPIYVKHPTAPCLLLSEVSMTYFKQHVNSSSRSIKLCCTAVPDDMEQCYSLYGTRFQMTWNTVPSYI